MDALLLLTIEVVVVASIMIVAPFPCRRTGGGPVETAYFHPPPGDAHFAERCISKVLYCSQNMISQNFICVTEARDSERCISRALYCSHNTKRQLLTCETGARDSARGISKMWYCSHNEEEQFLTFATGARDTERRIPKVLYFYAFWQTSKIIGVTSFQHV